MFEQSDGPVLDSGNSVPFAIPVIGQKPRDRRLLNALEFRFPVTGQRLGDAKHPSDRCIHAVLGRLTLRSATSEHRALVEDLVDVAVADVREPRQLHHATVHAELCAGSRQSFRRRLFHDNGLQHVAPRRPAQT